jgi:hypothetical protein
VFSGASGVSECAVSRCGCGLETRKGKSPPLEASTKELVKGQQTERIQCMCSELRTVRTAESARL